MGKTKKIMSFLMVLIVVLSSVLNTNVSAATVYLWNRYNIVTTTTYTQGAWSAGVSAGTATSISGYGNVWFETASGFLYSVPNQTKTRTNTGYVYTGTNISVTRTDIDDLGRLTRYYATATSKTTESRGTTSYGQVNSYSSSTYPSNGPSGSYWYVSAGSVQEVFPTISMTSIPNTVLGSTVSVYATSSTPCYRMAAKYTVNGGVDNWLGEVSSSTYSKSFTPTSPGTYTVTVYSRSYPETDPRSANSELSRTFTVTEPVRYTVTFDANGGVGTVPPPQTVTAGMYITLPSSTLTKVGYTGSGWNTRADGTGAGYPAGEHYYPTSNMTFYAQWRANPTLTVRTVSGTTFTSWNPSSGWADSPDLSVVTNQSSWSVSSNASWLTATKYGGDLLSLRVTENTSTSSRSGTVTVTAGTLSWPITVTQSAAIPIITAITASPTAPSFGSLQTGYTQPSAQTVTITNTGTANVTLSALPSVTNWTLVQGANWTTAMTPNQTRTFTIRPNVGLATNTYNPTITISGSGGASATVRPTFTVTSSTISASPTSPNFGSLPVGYTQPAAQTITITNTGTANVTLSALTFVTNWTLVQGANWTTAMTPGQNRTFTIQPNAGLAANTYNPTITISGSGGASATVRPTFTVTQPKYIAYVNNYYDSSLSAYNSYMVSLGFPAPMLVSDIDKATEDVSERYLRLLGLRLYRNDATWFNSHLDQCKGTVTESNVNNVCTGTACPNQISGRPPTSCNESHVIINNFINRWSVEDNSRTKNAYWFCHPMTKYGVPNSRAFANDIGGTHIVINRQVSSSVLMHELNHTFGASDHYHELINPNDRNSPCISGDMCSNPPSGSKCGTNPRPSTCVMFDGNTDISRDNIICEKCIDDMEAYLKDHHKP